MYRTKSSRARQMHEATKPKPLKPIPTMIRLQDISEDDIEVIGRNRKRRRLKQAPHTNNHNTSVSTLSASSISSPPRKRHKTSNLNKTLYPMFSKKPKPKNNTNLNTTMHPNDRILSSLSRFGFNKFRESQREAIECVLNKRDVLLLMPTGGGKSLCFQCPALILKKLVIVISPLLALIKNHCDALKRKNINAVYLNSTVTQSQRNKIFEDLQIYANNGIQRNNKYKEIEILYTTPEQIIKTNVLSDILQTMYTNNKIALFAIDECHCISSWGHDFRPSYRALKTLRIKYASVPIMALTATATMSVRNDIMKSLKLKNPKIISSDFDRPNLYFEFKYIENLTAIKPWNKPKTKGKRGRKRRRTINKKEITQINQKVSDDIYSFIAKHRYKDKCGLIYVFSRKDAETIAHYLKNEYKLSCDGYHAGMSNKKKIEIQDKWQHHTTNIIVATCAFGMGIDQSNVRFVIHCMMTKCLEAYYQEIGRAGRDNKASHILCYYAVNMLNKHKNIALKESIIKMKRNRRSRNKNEIKNMAQNDERYKQIIHNLEYVRQFAEPTRCRRQILLRYFNQDLSNKQSIRCCDYCDDPRMINGIRMQYEKKRKGKGNVAVNDDEYNDDWDPIEDIQHSSNTNTNTNVFDGIVCDTYDDGGYIYNAADFDAMDDNRNNNTNSTFHNQDTNDYNSDIVLSASMTANINGLKIETRENSVFQFLSAIEDNIKRSSNGSNVDVFMISKEKEMDILNGSNTNFVYGLSVREERERIEECTRNGILWNVDISDKIYTNVSDDVANINLNGDAANIKVNNDAANINLNDEIKSGDIDINGVYDLIKAMDDERDWMLSMLKRRSYFEGFINRWKKDLDHIYTPKVKSLCTKYKSDLYSIVALKDMNKSLDEERQLLVSLIVGYNPNERGQMIWNSEYNSFTQMEHRCNDLIEKRKEIIKKMKGDYGGEQQDDDDDDDLVILSLNKQHENVKCLLCMGFKIDIMNKAWCLLKNDDESKDMHPDHDSFVVKMLDKINTIQN